ncbi:MAG: outer membrane beta-barrel protein [Prevotellaceae bacterium]|jgi:hypothetical protein|nr:outer membrane beta-barrel protein [Prevotellaceae bacterium]
MNTRYLYILFLAFICTPLLNAQTVASLRTPVSGQVLDAQQEPIPFSTIIFMAKSDSTLLFTAITNDLGQFSTSVPYDRYRVEARCLGYLPALIQEFVATDSQPVQLPDMILEVSATSLSAAVVLARTIERKADRFIVNLSANPVSQGRSLHETLSFLPGVTTHNGISINGKSGTRVMINNRLLNMPREQVESYLKNLRASDIQRIEVIPDAGAEYDANATGGIIKITLKQQTISGYYGSISADMAQTRSYLQRSNPNINLSFRKDKWSVITNFFYYIYAQPDKFEERTDFFTTKMSVNNNNTTYVKEEAVGGEVSVVYDISDKQSVGLVANYAYAKNGVNTNGTSHTATPDYFGLYVNDNEQRDQYNRIGLSANFIQKLDTLGSTFTIMADWLNNQNENRGYFNTFFGVLPVYSSAALYPLDTLSYRNHIASNNNIVSTNVDLDYKLGRGNVKAGAKFFKSRLGNDIQYEDFIYPLWEINNPKTDNFTYTESVGALYASFASSFSKKWHYTIGLRGEYTTVNLNSQTHEEKTDQKYFDLFPTLNLSFLANPSKGHTLSLSANRKISRPNFDLLVPYSLPLNDFSIVLGSPDLKPAKSFNLTLTQTLFHKYSLSAGITLTKDHFAQMVTEKEEESDLLYYQFINLKMHTQCFVSLYTPLSISKWWTLITNVVGVYIKDEYTTGGKVEANQKPLIQANLVSNFVLPKGWRPEMSAMYMTGAIQGNFTTKDMYYLHAGCTKTLLQDKLVLTLRINNIIYNKLHIDIDGDTYQKSITNNIDKRTLYLSMRYSFNSPQRVNVKKVSTGVGEEKERLK